MIGSAVPPLLSMRIAKQVCSYLDGVLVSEVDRAAAR